MPTHHRFEYSTILSTTLNLYEMIGGLFLRQFEGARRASPEKKLESFLERLRNGEAHMGAAWATESGLLQLAAPESRRFFTSSEHAMKLVVDRMSVTGVLHAYES